MGSYCDFCYEEVDRLDLQYVEGSNLCIDCYEKHENRCRYCHTMEDYYERRYLDKAFKEDNMIMKFFILDNETPLVCLDCYKELRYKVKHDPRYRLRYLFEEGE